MSTDGVLAAAVREELRAGRFLALGGAADGVWITERAAARALRAAGEAAVPGIRAERLRIAPADPAALDWGAVHLAHPAAPPGATPAGELLLSADFAARPDRPLPGIARELRAALAAAARDGLGLPLAAIDLRAVGLLPDGPAAGPGGGEIPAGPGGEASAGPGGEGADAGAPAGGVPEDGAAEAAVRAVAGVRAAAVRRVAGGLRLYVVTAPGHRALDVARAAALAAAVPAGEGAAPATAVVVTGAG